MMTAVPVKIRKAVYKRLREEIEAGREPDNICDVVSKAVTFYLDSKKILEALNPLEVPPEEPHSKENTAKNRPAKAGLPVGVCASSRKSLSAESWASLLRVLNFEPAPRGSRRQVPAYIKVEDGSLLERFGKNLKELEEEAKRIVVKHPAFFDNFQRNDVGFRAVVRPDGSWSVEPLAPASSGGEL